MQTNFKRTVWIVAIVLLAAIGLMLYNASVFRVTNTTPSNKNYPSSLGIMEIHFNKELAVDAMQQRIKQNPADLVQLNFEGGSTVDVSKNKLIITFSQTPLPGKYTVSLNNIQATDGSMLSTTLPLHVKHVPYEKLSKKEKQMFEDLSKDADTDVVDEHPLLQKLPHETDNYLISYEAEEIDALNNEGHAHATPSLIITMKFFEPGSNAVPATAAERNAYLSDIRKYRTEAIQWLESNGFNLNDYHMQYSELDLREEFPQGKPE